MSRVETYPREHLLGFTLAPFLMMIPPLWWPLLSVLILVAFAAVLSHRQRQR